jgi:hypothetical protein
MDGQQGGGLMAKKSKLQYLDNDIKNNLIEKILKKDCSYQETTEWLLERHGIKMSKTLVSRLGKDTRDKYSALVDLGMPIKEIVKHRHKIEALGVEQVKQQLLAKLTEKNGDMFAYLGKKEDDH